MTEPLKPLSPEDFEALKRFVIQGNDLTPDEIKSLSDQSLIEFNGHWCVTDLGMAYIVNAHNNNDNKQPSPAGLHRKYVIRRMKDMSLVEEQCFVLNLEKDQHAQEAALAYASFVRTQNAQLADDLERTVNAIREQQGKKPMELFVVPYPAGAFTSPELGLLQTVWLEAAKLIRGHGFTFDYATPKGRIELSFHKRGPFAGLIRRMILGIQIDTTHNAPPSVN